MPTPTYTLISEQVLGSNQASVTFSSIPQTYKDLVLEVIGRVTDSSTIGFAYLYFNGDTGANYSRTVLNGTGSSASSARFSNSIIFSFDAANVAANTFSPNVYSIMSYANTNVFKSTVGRYNTTASDVGSVAMLWRSTAAITSLSVTGFSNNLVTGSTFRLWGVVG